MGTCQDYALELLGDRFVTVADLVNEMNLPSYKKLSERSRLNNAFTSLETYHIVEKVKDGKKVYWRKRDGN